MGTVSVSELSGLPARSRFVFDCLFVFHKTHKQVNLDSCKCEELPGGFCSSSSRVDAQPPPAELPVRCGGGEKSSSLRARQSTGLRTWHSRGCPAMELCRLACFKCELFCAALSSGEFEEQENGTELLDVGKIPFP